MKPHASRDAITVFPLFQASNGRAKIREAGIEFSTSCWPLVFSGDRHEATELSGKTHPANESNSDLRFSLDGGDGEKPSRSIQSLREPGSYRDISASPLLIARAAELGTQTQPNPYRPLVRENDERLSGRSGFLFPFSCFFGSARRAASFLGGLLPLFLLVPFSFTHSLLPLMPDQTRPLLSATIHFNGKDYTVTVTACNGTAVIETGNVPQAKPAKDVVPTSPEALAVAALFGRKPSTVWAKKEIAVFKDGVKRGVITLPNIELIAAYYAKERLKNAEGIHRRDLATFLNNFDGELDRAMAVQTVKRKPEPGFAGETNAQRSARWAREVEAENAKGRNGAV